VQIAYQIHKKELMACKCTQTTVNATGGGEITAPLSACTYPLWVHEMSGCTGSALDVHFGNPGANFLINIGQYDYSEVGYATNNVGINVVNPVHTLSVGGTIDVEKYLHLGDGVASGNTPFSVYLGYLAGETAQNNRNSSYNTVIGNASVGSDNVLDGANHNTVMGHGALGKLTSGDYNTILGSGAGVELTSQGGNVYLGYGQGAVETTEANTLRIGNQLQNIAGTTRPLIQGNFETSATTIWGSARITEMEKQMNSFVMVDVDGNLTQSSDVIWNSVVQKVGMENTGVWTANTTDVHGTAWTDGYRSVSISGGTNPNDIDGDWYGTRVGIGGEPEVPFHIKKPLAWMYVQSDVGASYIASITSADIAYLGVAASGGVQSGSTTWRTKAMTSPEWINGAAVGTGFSIMRVSREVAADSSTQKTVTPFSILGDSENLDGAIVVRGDTNLGAVHGGNKGVGIFTAIPTKELTVVGSISGTGAIHSTDYIQFPNPAASVYIGYGADSGDTENLYNTSIGYESFGNAGFLAPGASHNTSVGRRTLRQIATGSDNTAIGSQAGMFMQGDRNTAIGKDSNYTSGLSMNNTGVGYGTLYRNHTGRDNVALGHGAMYGGIPPIGQDHNYNTTIGAGSLSGITTGGCNVAVGNNAGAGITTPAGKITTGSNNIMIGCQVDVKDGTLDNQINIGDIVFGKNVGGGTIINRIGIGTSIPSHPLSVEGAISGSTDLFVKDSVQTGYLVTTGDVQIKSNLGVTGNTVITGTLTLGEDLELPTKSIGIGVLSPKTRLDVHHDPSGLLADTGGGDVIIFGSAGADYAAGFLVQLRGADDWVKADADDTTLQGNLMGIALGAAPSNGILLKGFYKINTADDVTTWSKGGQLYPSTVVGKITESITSHGSGDYVRVIGYMTGAEDIMYFDPESSFLVIT